MKCKAMAAAWFSTLLEKALVSRPMRRMLIRMVRLLRSTPEVESTYRAKKEPKPVGAGLGSGRGGSARSAIRGNLMPAEDYLDSQGFSHVGCLFLEKDKQGAIRIDNPQEGLNPAEWHKKLEPPFCRLRLPALPKAAGVYAIVVADVVVYVGQTVKGLDARINGYRKIGPSACKAAGGQTTNCRINHRILEAHQEGHTAHLWFKEFIDLERAILDRLDPSWNAQ